ncbi:hypothetical protein ACN47E_007000 [Coniothyrium glycines]
MKLTTILSLVGLVLAQGPPTLSRTSPDGIPEPTACAPGYTTATQAIINTSCNWPTVPTSYVLSCTTGTTTTTFCDTTNPMVSLPLPSRTVGRFVKKHEIARVPFDHGPAVPTSLVTIVAANSVDEHALTRCTDGIQGEPCNALLPKPTTTAGTNLTTKYITLGYPTPGAYLKTHCAGTRCTVSQRPSRPATPDETEAPRPLFSVSHGRMTSVSRRTISYPRPSATQSTGSSSVRA